MGKRYVDAIIGEVHILTGIKQDGATIRHSLYVVMDSAGPTLTCFIDQPKDDSRVTIPNGHVVGVICQHNSEHELIVKELYNFGEKETEEEQELFKQRTWLYWDRLRSARTT